MYSSCFSTNSFCDFPLLEFPFELLVPQLHVPVVVARVRGHPAVVQFERAGGDLVQKVPVVADDDLTLRLADKIIFEPARGGDVEVVARLVEEHHVRRGEENLRK